MISLCFKRPAVRKQKIKMEATVTYLTNPELAR